MALDEHAAEWLTRELGHRIGKTVFNGQAVAHALTHAEATPANPVIEVPDYTFTALEDYPNRRYSVLSLRRVIHTPAFLTWADGHLPPIFRKILPEHWYYSSDAILRDAGTDKTIANIIADSPVHLALLGKFEERDYDNAEERMYERTTPLLIVVPGMNAEKTREDLKAWEHEHIRYKKGVGPLQGMKPISKRQYLQEVVNT